MRLLNTLLSDDLPRSRVLSGLLMLIAASLMAGPFLFPGPRAFATLGSITIFIVVVCSYDLMLGYTRIVSFAHVMFFGLGAYGVALATQSPGNGFGAIAIGILAALLVSAGLSLLLGLLALRVRTLYFALVTLAVAFAFASLVTQQYTLTGGEDGLRVRLPPVLTPGFRPFADTLPFNGRHLVYYAGVLLALLSFLFLLRLVNSPFGHVLQAIRENETRAQALGYRTSRYRTATVVIAGLLATLAGAQFALFNRYVSPADTLDFQLMVFILIMCVMGGMGTLYGAVAGVTVFILARDWLQDLLAAMAGQLPPDGLLAALLQPERWLLWFGLLFVLSVYFFPDGIVGALRRRAGHR